MEEEEEEGEQLSNQNPKRHKTLNSKGKEKIQEEVENEPNSDGEDSNDDPTEEDACGICLSDASRSIRGRIDCCKHYFCFLCIMEWSKVETRCPLCKQRFGSITRPIKGSRPIVVTERNQVYNGLGNASVPVVDPYANVVCGECHTSTDEEHLLLCDLCDSASHTFCIGLGSVIPDGDWYCRDCSIVKSEHSKTVPDYNSSRISDSYDRLKAIRPLASHVSYSEDDIESSEESDASPPWQPIRTTISQRGPRSRVFVRGTASSIPVRVAANARTLQQSRIVQNRIRELRQNWNGLRSGYLVFRPSSLDNSTVTPAASRNPDSMSSTDATASKKTIHSADSKDVTKAWENMQKAKSIQEDRRVAVSTSLKISDNKPHYFASFGYDTPPCAVKGYTESARCSSFNFVEKYRSAHLEKERVHMHRKTMQKDQREHTKAPSSGYMNSSSFKQAWNSSLEGISNGKKGVAASNSHQVLVKCNEGGTLKSQGSTISSVSGQPTLRASNPSDHSGCKIDQDKGKKAIVSADQFFTKSGENVNSAKGDIQALVKLNLKLLNGARALDANKFKEIARLATHTILAACGLESSRPTRLPTSSICKHTEQVRELRKSNLMPNCCRECFFSYVKDVVHSVHLERTSDVRH